MGAGPLSCSAGKSFSSSYSHSSSAGGLKEPPDALLGHIRDGTTSANELAELLNVGKGTVSKWAAKLKAAGKITMKGRDYKAVD